MAKSNREMGATMGGNVLGERVGREAAKAAQSEMMQRLVDGPGTYNNVTRGEALSAATFRKDVAQLSTDADATTREQVKARTREALRMYGGHGEYFGNQPHLGGVSVAREVGTGVYVVRLDGEPWFSSHDIEETLDIFADMVTHGGPNRRAPVARHLTEYTLTDEQGRPRQADAAEPRRTPVEQAGHERNVKAIETGPLQYGQHVANTKEMLAMFGATTCVVTDPDGCKHALIVPSQADIDEHRKAIAADNRIRARTGLPLLDATDGAPQPTPAPWQVWLPPEGAAPPECLASDGTVTLAADWRGENSVGFGHGCGMRSDHLAAERGWTCVGVATPHGRVMVGDEFAIDGKPSVEVTGVCSHDGHVRLADGTAHGAAWLLAMAKRTRYAPARVGERYRWRETGAVETVETGSDGTLQTRSEHGVRPMRGLRGVYGRAASFDSALWERLDPNVEDRATTEKGRGYATRANIELLGFFPNRWDEVRRILDDAANNLIVPSRSEHRMPLEALKAHAAGRWKVHHPDPAVRAKAEAELNATGGTFTVPEGSARVSFTANDPAVQARPAPTLGEAFREGEAAIRELAGHMAKIDLSSDPLPELSLIVAPQPQPHTVIVRDGARDTLTLRAHARDLRALFDAIGRALESAAPEVVAFDGQPLSVLRSDACAEPSVHGGTIDACVRDLCVLRASVAQALADGRSYACQWGKGRTLTVERAGGPLVAAQPATEPAATHYDGAQGGPDAWRWEVGE